MENEISTSPESTFESAPQVKETATRTRRPRAERTVKKQAQVSSDSNDSFKEPVVEPQASFAPPAESEVAARYERMITPPPAMIPPPPLMTIPPVVQQTTSAVSEESQQSNSSSQAQQSNQQTGAAGGGYGTQESRSNYHQPRRKEGRYENHRGDRNRERNDFRPNNNNNNNNNNSTPVASGSNNNNGYTNNNNSGYTNNNYGNNNNRRDRNHNPRHHTNNRRDRPEMVEDEENENLVIDIELNDPRIVRIADLQRMTADQLLSFAKHSGVEFGTSSLTKSQIVFETVKTISHNSDEIIVVEGTLEVLPDGYGFLRSPIYNYLSSVEDIYISPMQIKRLDLRKGDTVVGTIRSPKEKEKYFALSKVYSINGVHPSEIRERALFENLTPLYPQERLVMETDKSKFVGRVIDLASPIGKGQRGIVVAPPRSGKTMILQQLAHSISINDPKAKLIMLLIDERPEEVTDMQRSIKGEVIASTFDEPPERHIQVCEMVIEKAKRLVEFGHDVIILLDSITRLARAYNTVQPHSGKILSGGIDANALHKPKRFFGAARNIEEGGSLTIIATALIETGSRMDEVIFEEFKGTGNMEIVLDRRLADRRVWPAIDLIRSGTRKEDLLYHPNELEKIYLFRQAIADLSPIDAMNLLLSRLKKTSSNTEFLLALKD